MPDQGARQDVSYSLAGTSSGALGHASSGVGLLSANSTTPLEITVDKEKTAAALRNTDPAALTKVVVDPNLPPNKPTGSDGSPAVGSTADPGAVPAPGGTPAAANGAGTYLGILKTFGWMGWAAFGGPAAHIGLFQKVLHLLPKAACAQL
jgi:hypothetical protein